MPRTYGTVVFMQGDDFAQAEREIYKALSVERDSAWVTPWQFGTVEFRYAAFEYLMQWEYGEGVEESDTPGFGTEDVYYFHADGSLSDRRPDNGYAVNWHNGLSYCGLTRITTEEA